MKKFLGLIVILYFVSINFYGALEMLNDKRIAEQNGVIRDYNKLLNTSKSNRNFKKDEIWRTSTKKFFQIAYLGGGTGIWLAMKKYNHKTKAKAAFIYNIPTYMGISYIVFILIFFPLIKGNFRTSFFVARNSETGKLLFFRIGHVRKAKYIMDGLPNEILMQNEFYLISSKKETPWEETGKHKTIYQ